MLNKFLILFFFNFFLLSNFISSNEENSSCPKKNDKQEEKKIEKDKDKKEDKEKEDENSPPPIGNFSLPSSQQPFALFGFGGNVIDQGEVQIFLFADDLRGKKRVIIDAIPSILFGITDELSIFYNVPFTPELRDGRDYSKGLEDFFVQFEYAYYNKKTRTYIDQATLVANMTTPTGSIHKNPNTGFGAPSFFLGGTYSRTLKDWFVFTGHGALMTCSNQGVKFGDQFLYQFGFGKSVLSPPGWIYAWMLEIDGQYNSKNKANGSFDPDSGGNIIFMTPSLWISSKEMFFQFGVSTPVTQHLYGKQNKFDYVLNFNLSWSFYPPKKNKD